MILLERARQHVHPSHYTAIAGSTALFHCTAYSHGIWKLPHGNWVKFLMEKSGRKFKGLLIKNLQLNDSGVYECYGDRKNKKYFFDNGILEVG